MAVKARTWQKMIGICLCTLTFVVQEQRVICKAVHCAATQAVVNMVKVLLCLHIAVPVCEYEVTP